MSFAELDRVIMKYATSTMALLFIVVGPSTDGAPPNLQPAPVVARIDESGHTGADGTDPDQVAPAPGS